MTFIETLLANGYPEGDIYHHGTDLYIFVTPLTTRLVKEYCKNNNFDMGWHFPTFTDQITGRLMYDCAFQYYDYKREA